MDDKIMIEEIEAIEVSDTASFTLGLKLYEYVDKEVGELSEDLHNLMVDAVADELEANRDRVDLIMDDKDLVNLLDLVKLENIMDEIIGMEE